MDDDDARNSSISILIARIEAYAADPSSFDIPGPSTRHELWLSEDSLRLDSAKQLADELTALQSIYTDEAIHLLKLTTIDGKAPSCDDQVVDPATWLPGSKITLSVSTELEALSDDAIPIRLAVTLPAFYPRSVRPPQLQLLSKYIGGFSVDAKLFGEILRAFYHQTQEQMDAEDGAEAKWIGGSMDKGVNWSPGEVVLFEGIEWVKEKVAEWWSEKEAERIRTAPATNSEPTTTSTTHPSSVTNFSAPVLPSQQITAFKGNLFRTESIVERKSEFIGYSASITSPDQVPSVLSLILSDKRVARATHPIINAWVCKTDDGVVHRDCDDDGETAAGGRLAHLLSILELENVIVVVTRWYGGVHLGPDRFKLINRAAREALDLGGFVGKNGGEDTGKAKGMRKRNS